jgi:glycine cleavage system H protein
MSVIIALTAALILIVGGMIRSRRPQQLAKPVLIPRYEHKGHTWLRKTDDGDVLVGIDDFAQSLIGAVDEIELPRLLRRIQQGEIAWQVRHGHRRIPMVSPVSGRVIEKNEMVMRNPGLINRSPFGDGWLIKVRPHKLSQQVQNLLTGKAAVQWHDTARAELGRLFSGFPALMYQDGGELMKNIGDRCSDEEWGAIAQEFFLVNDTTMLNRR